MSKAILVKLLKETLDMVRVDRKADKAYRALKSDMKQHSFRVHYRTIIKQIKVQLAFHYADPDKGDKYSEFTSLGPGGRKKIDAIIGAEAKKIASAAHRGAIADMGSFNGSNPRSKIDVQGGSSIFTVTAFISVEDQAMIKKWKGGEEIPQSVFARMKSYYIEQLRKSEQVIYQALSIKDKRKKGRLLDAGHFNETAVSLQQAKDAQAFFRDGFQDKLKDVGITSGDLRNLGIEISVSKSSDYTSDNIKMYLQSLSVNRSSGSKDAQSGPKAILREMLVKAIIRAEKSNARWTEAKGSDSRIDIEKKKVIKSFNKGVKKRSNVKKKSVDTKIKFSKVSKTSVKKEKAKITKAPSSQFNLGKLSAPPRSRKTKNANSSVALVALINARLPATVAENMGEPSLVHRTGRFANSVRVIEATQTKQGFPSIGYTYQKNPYQVFEDGAGVPPWANGQRDPRKLIDKSIREIAAELLVGRFYTRRI